MALGWRDGGDGRGWRDVRLALGSVAATPIRATATEAALESRAPTPETADRAAEMLAAELSPIDDVRSTAEYRRLGRRTRAPPVRPRGRRMVSTQREPSPTAARAVVPPAGVVPPIDVLDTLPRDQFVAAVAPLFEGAPAFLGRLADARPFESVATFFETARAIAHSMPVAEQIELIDAHPRLGAPPQTVSAASFVEQGYAAEGRGAALATRRSGRRRG